MSTLPPAVDFTINGLKYRARIVIHTGMASVERDGVRVAVPAGPGLQVQGPGDTAGRTYDLQEALQLYTPDGEKLTDYAVRALMQAKQITPGLPR